MEGQRGGGAVARRAGEECTASGFRHPHFDGVAKGGHATGHNAEPQRCPPTLLQSVSGRTQTNGFGTRSLSARDARG